MELNAKHIKFGIIYSATHLTRVPAMPETTVTDPANDDAHKPIFYDYPFYLDGGSSDIETNYNLIIIDKKFVCCCNYFLVNKHDKHQLHSLRR